MVSATMVVLWGKMVSTIISKTLEYESVEKTAQICIAILHEWGNFVGVGAGLLCVVLWRNITVVISGALENGAIRQQHQLMPPLREGREIPLGRGTCRNVELVIDNDSGIFMKVIGIIVQASAVYLHSEWTLEGHCCCCYCPLWVSRPPSSS